ncbi:bbb37432-16f6-462e-8f94-5bf0ae6e5ba0 [Sclerotinia trifoliorum]|uniref:Bbb37432-16f6-462e-8f94-5bf0ae6e5ba0 n=1 Tax=Sclerotinia trifoliorum TaxID=28548 RepID=A0A8H2ZRL5_9HELO|nr:bbb37432-16f6-462e-8f94-5bf0ae6e5ba0 [Sclerotinia trifoliorum]
MEVPNFDRLLQAFGIVVEECLRLRNVLVSNQGVDILNTIQGVTAWLDGIQAQMDRTGMQMNGMQIQMEDRLQRIDGRFDGLERRIMALDYNSASRAQNSTISYLDKRLSSLVDTDTFEQISDFPQTPADLNRITTITINRILATLEFNTDGNLDTKCDRLRITIGIRIGGV